MRPKCERCGEFLPPGVQSGFVCGCGKIYIDPSRRYGRGAATHQCREEGCEQLHCKRCGRHYEPCAETERAGGVCDSCLIGAASDETRRVTEAFGGNSEAAAQEMGW